MRLMARCGCIGLGLLASVTLAGCGYGRINNRTSDKPAAGVVEALPNTVAGPRQTIEIPRQTTPALMRAVAHNGQVHLFSRAIWHGSVVSLNYTPATNVTHKGDHLELVSARNVQFLTRTRVQPDGTWRTTWHAGDYGIPRHQPFFIMACDDKREIGLVQINTIN